MNLFRDVLYDELNTRKSKKKPPKTGYRAFFEATKDGNKLSLIEVVVEMQKLLILYNISKCLVLQIYIY